MTLEKLYTLFKASAGISTDTRKIEKNTLFFALKGNNFNGNEFAEKALQLGAAYAIIDEEAFKSSDRTILVDNVLDTLQKLATHHRLQLGVPILALTGSNGKTTTKELIAAVLSKKFKVTATAGNLNNHIGVPLTLLSMNGETEFGVVEMGANHIKEIGSLCKIALPDYGYITNFGKAHIEGFGSVEGVIQGKTELYEHLKENNKLIFYNADDSIQKEKTGAHTSYSFGQKDSAQSTIKLKDANPLVTAIHNKQEIKSRLIGSYNFGNIAASVAIGDYFKVSPNDIKDAIEGYAPSNNRSQLIEKGSNKIILDAYNANPTSMKAALNNFSELNDPNKIAILGDMFELGTTSAKEHQEIAEYINTLNIGTVFLVGSNFNQVKIRSSKVIAYKSFEDFKSDFTGPENTTLLIKGSRGMALERTLQLL